MSDLIDRAEAARRFPKNTCGASRHAEHIGVALVLGEPYPMLTEEPAYCGESILAAVASLWEARTEIERLTAERDRKAAELANLQVAFNDWKVLHSTTRLEVEVQRLTAEREEARAERDALANVLPGHYYMDPPDGGDVPVLEQLRRMSRDAARYRFLSCKGVPPYFHRCSRWRLEYWNGEWWDPLMKEELDAAIDAAMGLTRPAEES